MPATPAQSLISEGACYSCAGGISAADMIWLALLDAISQNVNPPPVQDEIAILYGTDGEYYNFIPSTSTGYVAVQEEEGSITIYGSDEEISTGSSGGHISVWPCVSDTDSTVSGGFLFLVANNTNLVGLDVSACVSMIGLSCAYNQLTTLDVSALTALTTLDCSFNQITSLDVSGLTSLTTLYCNSGQLTALDVSDCSALTNLDCRYNQLTTLDVSGLAALTTLDCSYNQLTALDASGCSALMNFNCSHNQLTALDVSGLAALTTLNCAYNQIIVLDVSGLTELTNLYCRYNQITSLDVSGCTALTILDCALNAMDSSSVDAVLVGTDSNGASNGTIIITNNAAPGVSGLLAKTSLEGRGWTVITD